MQIAVVGVVVVVGVSSKTHFFKKELVEHAQFLDRASVRWQTLFESANKLVNLPQDLLDVEFRVFVLGQADGRFE